MPRAVTLSAVVPLFDEHENLPALHARLTESFARLGVDYELVLVDDGSGDGTPEMLDRLAEDDPRVRVIHLSRNFGHQAAVTAGLEFATGDAVVVLDGDLQDPPEVIGLLLERWREGFDVVYAVRTKRKEGPFKRLGYFAFYRLLRTISELDIPLDTGDFCLMDRCAVDALNALPERSRFIRGLRTFVGFRQIGVGYERDARHAGTPKYTFRKLVALAQEGVVNFSTAPMRMMGWCAGACLIASGGIGIWMAGDALLNAAAPAGWLVATLVGCLLSALQLGCMAVMGLYLLQIFREVKARPTYIVRGAKEPRGARMARPRSLASAR